MIAPPTIMEPAPDFQHQNKWIQQLNKFILHLIKVIQQQKA
jgi:hypothetical protein